MRCERDLGEGGGERFSLRARLGSGLHAARGLRQLVRREHNAWVHVAATVLVVLTGAALRVSASDWRGLILAMALVWLCEAFNTSIERLCDRLHPSHDAAIGEVKDLAAGGVLVAAIAAALIGLLTFLPRLLERLS